MSTQPMRNIPFLDATRTCERAHDELLRHTDAKAAGDELVPDVALGALELAPGVQD